MIAKLFPFFFPKKCSYRVPASVRIVRHFKYSQCSHNIHYDGLVRITEPINYQRHKYSYLSKFPCIKMSLILKFKNVCYLQ